MKIERASLKRVLRKLDEAILRESPVIDGDALDGRVAKSSRVESSIRRAVKNWMFSEECKKMVMKRVKQTLINPEGLDLSITKYNEKEIEIVYLMQPHTPYWTKFTISIEDGSGAMRLSDVTTKVCLVKCEATILDAPKTAAYKSDPDPQRCAYNHVLKELDGLPEVFKGKFEDTWIMAKGDLIIHNFGYIAKGYDAHHIQELIDYIWEAQGEKVVREPEI